ncbi:OLC1v1018980C1 [Oldenlandia corymbosa var. corymbosa]|uniref:OLC1v1018980C1 n=1 Tax=Oldenlandia corymbosa var. corymbosa TaxID=529605 RepID=A0AAV1ECY9_OLDCO|nr:OLC1v1018980C1 [Oldenlandia corymbosa var. corymbosa]
MAQPIGFDEGWQIVQGALTKLEKSILEGKPEPLFTSEEYMTVYHAIYLLCVQREGNNYYQALYDKYKQGFEDYLSSVVLPSLQGKQDAGHESLLREFVKRWSDHKVMVRWKSWFFQYLDRYFAKRDGIPGVTEVGFNCFRDVVYSNVKGKVQDAVCFLIDQERKGEREIDGALIDDVADVLAEIGRGRMNLYENEPKSVERVRQALSSVAF